MNESNGDSIGKLVDVQIANDGPQKKEDTIEPKQLTALDLIDENIDDPDVLQQQYDILIGSNPEISAEFKGLISKDIFKKTLEAIREGMILAQSCKFDGVAMGTNAIPSGLRWYRGTGKEPGRFKIGILPGNILGVTAEFLSQIAFKLAKQYPMYTPGLQSFFSAENFAKLILIEECAHSYDISVNQQGIEDTRGRHHDHPLEMRANAVVRSAQKDLEIFPLSELEIFHAKVKFAKDTIENPGDTYYQNTHDNLRDSNTLVEDRVQLPPLYNSLVRFTFDTVIAHHLEKNEGHNAVFVKVITDPLNGAEPAAVTLEDGKTTFFALETIKSTGWFDTFGEEDALMLLSAYEAMRVVHIRANKAPALSSTLTDSEQSSNSQHMEAWQEALNFMKGAFPKKSLNIKFSSVATTYTSPEQSSYH